MFLTNLHTRSTTAAQQRAAAELPLVLRPAAGAIRGLWAARTWHSRASLILRSRSFAIQHRLTDAPLGVQHTAFISNLHNCSNSTKAGYVSALAAVSRRLGHQVPMLDMLGAALRADGESTIPTRQAVPATRRQVFALVNAALRQDRPSLAVLIYLAWKSSSRIDDLLHLVPESVLNLEEPLLPARPFFQLVLLWAQTKTNRRQEFRPDSVVVIWEEDQQLWPWLCPLVRDVLRQRRRRQQHIFDGITTEQVRRFMSRTPGCEELTGHSIKRGAVSHLVDQALLGRLHDTRLISLLAKHKDELHAYPTATLRYVPDKVKLALMLGTQHATRLL